MAHKYTRKLTPNERASLFGDELTQANDTYERDPTPENRRIAQAALIGRCASMAAQAVLPLKEQLEGIKVELADLWIWLDAQEAAHRAASE